MATTVRPSDETEVGILSRVFDDERGRLTPDLARSIVDIDFSARDKARMHDLAVRNQNDDLTDAEKNELIAFAKAGSLLSILQPKARRTLGVKDVKRPSA